MISTTGQFYDGQTPVPGTVQILVTDEGLQILATGGRILMWKYADLREQSSNLRHDRMIISPASDPSAFLSFEHAELVAQVRGKADNLQKDFRVETPWLAKLWAGLGAVCIVVLILLYGVVPFAAKHIANYVPYGFEQNLGQAAEDAFADILSGLRDLRDDDSPVFCEAPEVEAPLVQLMSDLHDGIGQVALGGGDADLAERWQEVGVPSIKIANSGVINAFALPGGRVVVFRGLLEEAVDNFDALGLILAHETAHVMERHNMRIVLSDAAARVVLSAIISGLLDSPEFNLLASEVLNAGYTLEMEREADRLGIAWAKDIGIDPSQAAAFFEYLTAKAEEAAEAGDGTEDGAGDEAGDDAETGAGIDLFATHPPSDERIAQLRAHATNSTIGDRYGDYGAWLEELAATCPKPKTTSDDG